MSKRLSFLSIAILVVLIFSTALAQSGDCPALVEKALAEMSNNCGDLGRNSVCYGFNRIDATFLDTAQADLFKAPSDRTELVALETIQTAPLDATLERWGIAVMNVQANVPNSLPGQGVVFLLLGDVKVDNAVAPEDVFQGAEPVAVTTLVASNLRSFPTTTANVVGNAPQGTALQADGLSPDGEWLRVIFETGPAWISRSLVSSDADLGTLPVISRENRSPMQSFYFSTGFGNPTCNEAPPSTLVIQGPKGVKVDITANGADISLGSTIALQSLEDGWFQLFVLDGAGEIGGLPIPAGFTILVKLGEDGKIMLKDMEPMTQDQLDHFMPLEGIDPNLLHYPIDIPDLGDILALQAALAQKKGNAVGNSTEGPGAGEGDCKGFKALSPLGTMDFAGGQFEWVAWPGATHYVVQIFANDLGGALTFSQSTAGPETSMFINGEGIGSGEHFDWVVIAMVGDQVGCTSGRAPFNRTGAGGPVVPGQPGKFGASWACVGRGIAQFNWKNLKPGAKGTLAFFDGVSGPQSYGFSGPSGSMVIAVSFTRTGVATTTAGDKVPLPYISC